MCVCVHTSPCVPLLQASEKMELTTLWERVCPDEVISETPLSDWLEWLDWDSVSIISPEVKQSSLGASQSIMLAVILFNY